MSRDLEIEKGGFPLYAEKNLPKINAMRRVFSQPDFHGVPIIQPGQVLFDTAESIHDEPTSCYNCRTQNPRTLTCKRIGPELLVKKFIRGGKDGNPIEYWPCCGMHDYGEPSDGACFAHDDPTYLGLVWINAPEVGQAHGGANCAGINGGDDCDSYFTRDSKAKWESTTGFCRVLQKTVAAGDVCAAWQDDDEVSWQEAQQILKGMK
jgi:hypothetical protein